MGGGAYGITNNDRSIRTIYSAQELGISFLNPAPICTGHEVKNRSERGCVVIVEVHDPGYSFGVRSVGEVPIVPPLATIVVYEAIGARIDDLPLTPDRVPAAMQEKTD